MELFNQIFDEISDRNIEKYWSEVVELNSSLILNGIPIDLNGEQLNQFITHLSLSIVSEVFRVSEISKEEIIAFIQYGIFTQFVNACEKGIWKALKRGVH